MAISSRTEIDRATEDIVVPLQHIYSGNKPVIPVSLANTPCAGLGIQGVCDKLNASIGTSYPLIPSLVSVIEDCIRNNYNFSTVYGHLRGVWYKELHSITGILCESEAQGQQIWEQALGGNLIVNPYVYPRCLWDPYSNRVVPCWTMHGFDTLPSFPSVGWMFDPLDSDSEEALFEKEPATEKLLPLAPISHAWVDKNDHTGVEMPINGWEWPVPTPKDADLDLIRIEMLILGLEYMWLDVLCLRQRGGKNESLCEKEWMLDVPTIGKVYRRAVVYTYLSGLGRPLSVKLGDFNFDKERCWFNCAWTLQKISHKRIICGHTDGGPFDMKPDKDGKICD